MTGKTTNKQLHIIYATMNFSLFFSLALLFFLLCCCLLRLETIYCFVFCFIFITSFFAPTTPSPFPAHLQPSNFSVVKSRALFVSHTYAHRCNTDRRAQHTLACIRYLFVVVFCFLFLLLASAFVSGAIFRVFYCIFGRQACFR